MLNLSTKVVLQKLYFWYFLGYYVCLSFPVFHPDYIFDTYLYHPQPLFWRDHVLMIKPDLDILGISIQHKELFIETSMDLLAAECIKVFNKFLCPRMSNFRKDKDASCLSNLHKPSLKSNQSDILSKCKTFIMPKTEMAVEIAPLKFQFYYPNSHTVTVSCHGKEGPENIDKFTNQITLKDETCELHLKSQVVRSMRSITPPTTDNPYTPTTQWFDTVLGPIEKVIPPKPIAPLLIDDLLSYDETWKLLHFHQYESKMGIGLYVCIAISAAVVLAFVCFLIKNYSIKCLKKSSKSDSESGSASASPSAPDDKPPSYMHPVGRQDPKP